LKQIIDILTQSLLPHYYEQDSSFLGNGARHCGGAEATVITMRKLLIIIIIIIIIIVLLVLQTNAVLHNICYAGQCI